MKKEVDFIQMHEQQQKEIDSMIATKPELGCKTDLSKLHLLMDMVDLREAQYRRVRNEEAWQLWTQVFYDMACRTAKIQGGKVTLDINEESLTGQLTYLGHELMFSNAWNEDIEFFAGMVDLSEDFFISQKDGMIEIQFLFHVYDTEKIADYSDRIEEIERQVFSPEYLEYLHSCKG